MIAKLSILELRKLKLREFEQLTQVMKLASGFELWPHTLSASLCCLPGMLWFGGDWG